MKTTENQKTASHQSATQKPFFVASPEQAFFSTQRAESTPFFQPKAVSPSAIQAKSATTDAEGISEEEVQRMPAFESEVTNNGEVQRKLINSPLHLSALPIQAKLTHVVQQNGGKDRQEPSPPQPLLQYPAIETPSASEGESVYQAKGDQAKVNPASVETQRPNHTDLPDDLKSGIEALSGISMDDVNVHYNSSQPARLNALAYTKGRDIHVAPGQERHLPHEAWHVVQQTQGRVKPTMQRKDGVLVNEEEGLEQEADVMGAKALVSAVQGQGTEEEELLKGKSRSDPAKISYRPVMQLGKDGKKRKGRDGRRTEKKQGSKAQRDKRPGIMGDEQVGQPFIEFWHSFKQKHGGNVPDFEAHMLESTLRDLVPQTKSEDADKTVHWFFSRYLEKRYPALYRSLLPDEEPSSMTPTRKDENDPDSDDESGGGLMGGDELVAQSKADLWTQPVQRLLIADRDLHCDSSQSRHAVVQRVLKVEGKEVTPKHAWNILADKLDVSQSGALRVLQEWDDDDQEYDDYEELAKFLANAGYNVVIDGEEVFIKLAGNNEEEQKQKASDIMMAIKLTYGISLNSRVTKSAIQKSLDLNRKEIGEKVYKMRVNKLQEIETDSWTLEDLEALLDALSKFGNILGKKRANSPRSDLLQEITTIGKFTEAVDFPTTLAETFQESKHITLYEEGTTEDNEKPDKKEKTRTLIHELTHGLLEHRLADFEKAVPYWARFKQGEEEDIEEDFNGEKPPTDVAQQTASEDMAESVMMYLYDKKGRKKLKDDYPLRFAVVKQIVEAELG